MGVYYELILLKIRISWIYEIPEKSTYYTYSTYIIINILALKIGTLHSSHQTQNCDFLKIQ
jgi:hypothetical protein